MKRAFIQIRKHWVMNLVALILSLVVFAGIFCAVFFSRFDEQLVAAIDGATFGTMAVLLFGILSLLAHFGAFDIFAYGFKQMFTSIFGKKANKENSYYDYKQVKTEKRTSSSYSFVTFILTGLLCAHSIIVLEIIFQVLINS